MLLAAITATSQDAWDTAIAAVVETKRDEREEVTLASGGARWRIAARRGVTRRGRARMTCAAAAAAGRSERGGLEATAAVAGAERARDVSLSLGTSRGSSSGARQK